MRLVLLACLALLAAVPLRAQCCGDCNGDGTVAINELIIAVNNALDGCAAGPTPTVPPAGSCTIDFSDDNTQLGTPDCIYAGRWNPTCGDDQLRTVWRSEGSQCATPPCLVLVIFTEFDNLDCGGQITSPTQATLVGCFLGPNQSDFVAADGPITLGNQGSTLTMDPTQAPFTIGSDQCPVERYDGNLVDVVTPTSGAAERRLLSDTVARLQRLRAVRADKPAPPNVRRP